MTAPLVSSFEIAGGLGSTGSTRLSPVSLDLFTDEAVTGVSPALVSTSGSTAGVGSVSVSQSSPSHYVVTIPLTAAGTLVASLAAPAGVKDLAGNDLEASALTVTVEYGKRPCMRGTLALLNAACHC